ncbi:MAG: arginine deiminase family protein [Bacteroidota bacterium]
MTSPPPLHVSSETGPLRQVLVHTPGEEMALVSPENKDELLFDDILFADEARDEHEVMTRLFRRVVGHEDAVLQLSDLVREAFETEDARQSYVQELIELLPERNFEAYRSELADLGQDGLHRFALTGQAPFPVSAHPLPNLLFTRDLAAVVGGHVVMSTAARAARRPESALIRTVLRHHPRFTASRDLLIELDDDVSFEGGDLLVVSEKLVLVGQSERTSLGGAVQVARQLLAKTSVEHVVIVNLPKQRACMHLDTVFTFADESTCVVYPPIVEGLHDNVYELRSLNGDGTFEMRVHSSLHRALETLTEREMTFIPCGDTLVSQQREQWTDGANLFALRPGLVVGYTRNRETYAKMREHGFHVVGAEDFLQFYGDGQLPTDGKIAIRLEGNELSRGRGGPRCMTMPLVRN